MSYKLTMFLRSNRYGSTETYYFNNDSLFGATVEADIKALVRARSMLLGSGAEIQGVRLTNLADPGSSLVITDPGFSMTVDSKVTAIADPWIGVMLNLYSAGNVYRRSLILRFCHPQLSVYNPASPNAIGASGARLGLLKRFRDLLLTGKDTTGKGGSTYGFHARAKYTVPPNKVTATSVRVATDGSGRFIITAPLIPDFSAGQMIHVHGFTDCTLKGINGDHIVAALTEAVAPRVGWDYTLQARQCCVGPITLPRLGTIYPVRYSIVPFADSEIRCVRVKRVGRRFFATRGRAGKRACP